MDTRSRQSTTDAELAAATASVPTLTAATAVATPHRPRIVFIPPLALPLTIRPVLLFSLTVRVISMDTR